MMLPRKANRSTMARFQQQERPGTSLPDSDATANFAPMPSTEADTPDDAGQARSGRR
jgi:hypothetical protein